MKNKFLILSIILIFLIINTSSISIGRFEELKHDINPIFNTNEEPLIIINTDKDIYIFGESVKIKYSNIGKTVAGFIIGTARPTIPKIIDSKTGQVILLTNPTLCYPCIMIYGVLEPGKNFTIEWNQQYFGYIFESFNLSEQIHSGYYIAELEYWKVIDEYNPPYSVPGGPPDKIAISNVFKITKSI
jgi:hypothetical protein